MKLKNIATFDSILIKLKIEIIIKKGPPKHSGGLLQVVMDSRFRGNDRKRAFFSKVSL